MNDENQSRFLNLDEAASNANVGQETILKYKDLGLLQAFRINGQEQFREDEIRLVFNSRKKSLLNQTKKTDEINSEAAKNSQPKIVKTESNRTPPNHEDELPTLNDILKDNVEIETVSQSNDSSATSFEDNTWENSPSDHNVFKSNVDSGNSHHFDIPSIELLELTRSLKDQLETIREERNWLRRRVEKLESTIEREQMITISKDETLRNLIEQHTPPRKPWAFLLPWNK